MWTGYDQPERIYCSGNPAAQIFKKIMRPIHEGLEYKSFPWPYIGGDTGIFGVEEEEEEEDETIIEGDDGDIIQGDDNNSGGDNSGGNNSSGDNSGGNNSSGDNSGTVPEPPDSGDDNIIIIG